MRNCEAALALAAQLGEPRTLVHFAVALAELLVGCARNLPSAAAALDGVTAALLGGCGDPPLRCSLLRRVLPMSIEVLAMQVRLGHSCEAWALLMGRSECAQAQLGCLGGQSGAS